MAVGVWLEVGDGVDDGGIGVDVEAGFGVTAGTEQAQSRQVTTIEAALVCIASPSS